MKKVDRRSFLRLGAVTGLAAGIPVNAAADGALPASSEGLSQGVKNYVRLGRTELKVSDISFGSFPLRHGEEHVVHHAMDQGINYFSIIYIILFVDDLFVGVRSVYAALLSFHSVLTPPVWSPSCMFVTPNRCLFHL